MQVGERGITGHSLVSGLGNWVLGGWGAFYLEEKLGDGGKMLSLRFL